jgi:CRP-like cAMP-binding protein
VTAISELLTMSIGRSAFAKLLRSETSVALAVLCKLAQRLRAADRLT